MRINVNKIIKDYIDQAVQSAILEQVPTIPLIEKLEEQTLKNHNRLCLQDHALDNIDSLIESKINETFDLNDHIAEHHIEDMYCFQSLTDDVETNVENISNLEERLSRIENLLEALKEALK